MSMTKTNRLQAGALALLALAALLALVLAVLIVPRVLRRWAERNIERAQVQQGRMDGR